MKRRRLLTALLAVVLATTGAVLLTHYVRGADERALAGMRSVDVLVVTRTVAAGTDIAGLADSVTTKALPATAVATGALSSLDEAGGRVTGSVLQPGEQVLDTKLVDPAPVVEEQTVDLPEDQEEVSISLERQRMLGAVLQPGSRVGVYVSLGAEGESPARTKLVVAQVLVMAVGDTTSTEAAAPDTKDGTASTDKASGAASGGTAESDGADAAVPAATDTVLVRLALSPDDAEKVLFGVEQGRVWLSHERDGTDEPDTPGMTRAKVFK